MLKDFAEGLAEGLAEGCEAEARRYSALTVILLKQKRYSDLEKAANDDDFRKALYKNLGIK